MSVVYGCSSYDCVRSLLFSLQNLQIKGDFGQAAPFVIFGGLSFIAGVLALVLPETLGVDLPDTIKEAENFGK